MAPARCSPSTRSRRRGASRRSARHARSRSDERVLAPRGRAMPLGISDPGRLGTRSIDGAARAVDRRKGSLVHGAADADLWSTLALFESRLARSLGRGGVWLAGDAAHQAAPVSVHSMNSGLVESRELAARISRVKRAGAPPSLLEEFANERTSVATAPRRGPGGARASRGRPVGPGGPGEDRRLDSCLGRRPRTAAQADRPHSRAVRARARALDCGNTRDRNCRPK